MWNRSENKIKLSLIRHGFTNSNSEKRYLGKSDEPLSSPGQKLLKENINIYPKLSYIFSSPMKRCLQTAKILYPGQEIIKINEFEEMDFGDFEGKNYHDLKKNPYYQKWIDSEGKLPFPKGESREDFINRTNKGFYKIITWIEKTNPDHKALSLGIIGHGGSIMAILSSFYGGDYFDYQIANGDFFTCQLEVVGKNPKITKLKKTGEMN